MSGRQRAKWASSPGNKRTKTKRHEHQKKQTRMPRGCGCSDTGHARCDGVLWGAPHVADTGCPCAGAEAYPGCSPHGSFGPQKSTSPGPAGGCGQQRQPLPCPLLSLIPAGLRSRGPPGGPWTGSRVLRGKPGDSGPRALRRGSRRHRPLQRRRVLGHPEATPSSSWLPPPCSLSGPNAASSGLGDAAFDPHPGSWRPLPSP